MIYSVRRLPLVLALKEFTVEPKSMIQIVITSYSIHYTKLYDEHAGRIGEKHRAHQIELGIRLKNILPHLRRKKCIAYPDNQYGIEAGRPYFYELPSLDDCRKYFEKLSKSKLDWGDDDTDDTDRNNFV